MYSSVTAIPLLNVLRCQMIIILFIALNTYYLKLINKLLFVELQYTHKIKLNNVNHFKIHSSIALNIFTLLYNHHRHPSPEFFKLLKLKL